MRSKPVPDQAVDFFRSWGKSFFVDHRQEIRDADRFAGHLHRQFIRFADRLARPQPSSRQQLSMKKGQALLRVSGAVGHPGVGASSHADGLAALARI